MQVKDKHFITLEVRDMNGAPTGLFNTATATILLEDINDNPPTFSKTSVSILTNLTNSTIGRTRI